jgi:hypothetical protein
MTIKRFWVLFGHGFDFVWRHNNIKKMHDIRNNQPFPHHLSAQYYCNGNLLLLCTVMLCYFLFCVCAFAN